VRALRLLYLNRGMLLLFVHYDGKIMVVYPQLSETLCVDAAALKSDEQLRAFWASVVYSPYEEQKACAGEANSARWSRCAGASGCQEGGGLVGCTGSTRKQR